MYTSSGSFVLLGEFFWHNLDRFSLLDERSVRINKNSLWLFVTKQVDDCENDVNNSMCDLRSHQISTRWNTCRSFCTGVLNGSPHHHYHQNTK